MNKKRLTMFECKICRKNIMLDRDFYGLDYYSKKICPKCKGGKK